MKKTNSTRCEVKGCVRLGNVKFVAQWSYYICPEHYRALSDADKRQLAKTHGTKDE
jgi:hypothetical protein